MASLLGKHKVTIETGNLADGDSIAAYLTSAAGTLLTHTTIGAKAHLDTKGPSEQLDGSAYSAGTHYLSATGAVDESGNYQPLRLNAADELLVSATVNFAGDYAEDSAHVSGDIGLFNLSVRRDTRSSGTSADGDYASFNTNSVGELWVKDADALAQLVLANSSLDAIEASVAAIDVDTSTIITELQAANSSLDAIESDADAIRVELLDQGVTLDAILADTATIDSQTLSIQNTLTALSKAEDAAHSSGDQGIQALAVRKDANGSNAADGDYTSLLTTVSGALKVDDTANGAILQQQVSVANTATLLPASALSGRKSLLVQNAGSSSIWIGSATVTASGATAGIEVPKGGFIELEVGPAVSVYGISGGTVNANLLQMA